MQSLATVLPKPIKKDRLSLTKETMPIRFMWLNKEL